MTSNEKKGLLDKAKDAVADAVSKAAHSPLGESLTTGARHALEKLEEIAPAAVAGPVHAVAEAAASLLPGSEKSPAEAPSSPIQARISARPPRRANPQAHSQTGRADQGFKVKRGQKH